MQMPRMVFACLCTGLLFASAGAPAQVRKWVEPDGRVIYADTRPSATATEAGMTKGGAATTTAAPAAGSGRNEAGKIELVEGSVQVIAADRTRRAPKVGESLYEGDAIVTDKDGELQAEMADSGVIAVRPNTQMRIAKYQANGDAADTSVFGLLKGSFRSITGWIGKNNPKNYLINTPTATVGVRGTDHEPLVIPAGSTEGEAGTYDKVAAGGTTIRSQAGSVDVSPGKAGFANGRERPRELAQVPAFFRATRNESRLEGRHERVMQRMEQRRGERQKFIQERRTQAQAARQQRLGGNQNAQDRNRRAQELRQERQQQRGQRRELLHR
jgi:hypothetical protein